MYSNLFESIPIDSNRCQAIVNEVNPFQAVSERKQKRPTEVDVNGQRPVCKRFQLRQSCGHFRIRVGTSTFESRRALPLDSIVHQIGHFRLMTLWAPSRPNRSINFGARSRLSPKRPLVIQGKTRPVRIRRASLPPGGSIVEEMKYEDVFYTYFYVDSSCACIDPTGPAAAGPFSKWKPDVSTFFKEGIEIGRPLVDW